MWPELRSDFKCRQKVADADDSSSTACPPLIRCTWNPSKIYTPAKNPNVAAPGVLQQGTVSADFQTVFDSFRWDGTAPSCDGSCSSGEVTVNQDSSDDGSGCASFGSECYFNQKALCGRPSTCNTCPQVGSAVPAQAASVDGRTTTCSWDAYAVKTEDDMKTLSGLIADGQIPAAAGDVLAANYCFAPVESAQCGFDMTGKRIPKCARLKTSAACEAWRRGAITRVDKDGRNVLSAAMGAYCTQNKENADCDCLQAQSADPSGPTYEIRRSYQELQQAISEPAGCWYAPCNPETSYALVDPTVPAPKCPKPLCEVVVTAGNDSKIDLNKNVITQKCVGKETGDPKLMYIVLGVAAGILLIVLIAAIVSNSNLQAKVTQAEDQAQARALFSS